MGVCVSCKIKKKKQVIKLNTNPKKENNDNNNKEKKITDTNLKYYFTQSLNFQKLDTIKEEPSILNATTFNTNNFEQKNENKNYHKFKEINKSIEYQKKENENKKITFKITDTSNETIIFGDEFVKENKNKLKLIIEDKKIDLCNKFLFNNIGENSVIIIEEIPITSMNKMFYNCEKLISIDNMWDLKNITDTSEMFYNCTSLKKIENLKNWDMGNVKNVSQMFYGCKNLQSIQDIENWDMKNVNNIEDIFTNCGFDDNIIKDLLKKWNLSF